MEMVRRGSAVRVRERASEVPADQLLSSSDEATETRRGVHRAFTSRRRLLVRGREVVLLSGLAGRWCDVHAASTARSSASASRRGDCVFAAVEGEVAVVAVDHRDARAHEPGEGEDGYACAEREGGVGVAQV